MIQQQNITCRSCKGAGESIPKDQICGTCSGKKTIKSPKKLDIEINTGINNDESIVFHQEAHQEPGLTPGDIIITVQVDPHPVFKRKGPNLIMIKQISLQEALSGFCFDVTTLDGRTLKVRSDPNGLICSTNDIKKIRGEGMPMGKNSFTKGDLFITLNVITPKLSFRDAEQVGKILEKPAVTLPAKDESGVVIATDVAGQIPNFEDYNPTNQKKQKKTRKRTTSSM